MPLSFFFKMTLSQTELFSLTPPDNYTFSLACELPSVKSQLLPSYKLVLPSMGKTLVKYVLGTAMSINELMKIRNKGNMSNINMF